MNYNLPVARLPRCPFCNRAIKVEVENYAGGARITCSHTCPKDIGRGFQTVHVGWLRSGSPTDVGVAVVHHVALAIESMLEAYRTGFPLVK